MHRAIVAWTEPRLGVPDALRHLERAGCQVRLGCAERGAAMSEAELIELICDADGLMTGGRDRITARVLEAGDRLVVVSKAGSGTDRIDVARATELGVLVVNTPVGEHSDAVAEVAVALLLTLAKQMRQADAAVRSLNWALHDLVLLRDKTVGLIGYGRIGRRVGRILTAFGMRVLVHDPVFENDDSALAVTLPELAHESDVISLHAALTDQTRHIVDRDFLARVKPSVLIVNTARGGLIDEAALVEALREGRVRGAGLNVLSQEPPPADLPILDPGLRDRVLLSPHGAGSGHPEVFRAITMALVRTHTTVLTGQPPSEGIVNPDVLPKWRGHHHAPLESVSADSSIGEIYSAPME